MDGLRGEKACRACRAWGVAGVAGVSHAPLPQVLFMHAYATGRLPYLDDSTAFGTTAGLLNFALSCFWVPVWRTFHFYFAHRYGMWIWNVDMGTVYGYG